MSGRIIAFFRASPPKRWQTFITMTLAYVTFYVCRLSFTVAKSALVELGITPTELGMIGSTLFFSYAIGKLVNGFIADHANVVRYMSLGLLLSAGMNLMMGMTSNAMLLAIFWGINGWAQSMGVGPCVVSLARWYGCKERGTFYAIWSTAHNIGEAMTYMVIAAVIAGFGWQMGYLSTAALGAAGVVLMLLFMRDSPQSCGFPSINVIRDEPLELALASAFMYIDRYAVNSWGIFFLEQDKAYSTLEASGIIGVNAIAGIAGTIIAGMLSDRFFPRNRSVMAGFISLLNTAGFALMLWSPHGYYTDILAMIIFGATIGALTCFLGGLIAVDISSRKAAGAALGTIGIASYAGAGLGEFLTGIIIDKTSIIENGKTLYDFSTLSLFWVGTGLMSALFCFTTAAIVARRHAIERQTSFSS
ncbi:MAG: MFS transporter [Klebsiella michiganensis]|nr:MFS transporter [Klebsiella michiganensis]